MSKCPVPHFKGVSLNHSQCALVFAGLAGAILAWSSYKKSQPRLFKVEDSAAAKKEGTADEIGGFMVRICALFAKMDLDHSDSIEMSELESLGYSKDEAEYIMGTLDADKNGSISCDELVAHFLGIKTSYGMNKMVEHIGLFETAVDKYQGSKAAAGAPKQNVKADLPSTWMPIMVSRISSIYKRIDANGDNSVDKSEILALQHGNNVEADAMFSDLDADGDGSISAHEFLSYFMGLLKKLTKSENLDSLAGPKATKAVKKINTVLANLENKLNKRDGM
jgi:Ca2+-binding EF-hand superfamily protein